MTMRQQELLNEFLSLPAEAQRQVIDFIAFLRQRYKSAEPSSESADLDLVNDNFMGMWRDRRNLPNSNAWVRSIRE